MDERRRLADEAQRLALLDRFAVAALTGLATTSGDPPWVARSAWDLAEAMVKERTRRSIASPAAESPAPTPVPPTT